MYRRNDLITKTLVRSLKRYMTSQFKKRLVKMGRENRDVRHDYLEFTEDFLTDEFPDLARYTE